MRTECSFEVRIAFIRHGKTSFNEEGRYISFTDQDLSENGIKEIEELASKGYYLWDKTRPGLLPQAIYVSSLKRTAQTANLIFKDMDLRIRADINEINFGDFEGKTYEELKDNKDYLAWLDSYCSLEIPNGESREAFTKRQLKAFKEILYEVRDLERVAVVCHGGMVMALVDALTDLGYYDIMLKSAERMDATVGFDIKGNNDVSISSFSITSRYNI